MLEAVGVEVAEDAELTAEARRVDGSARVVVENGSWWLIDAIGRVDLGRDRMTATRDLLDYLALLADALSEQNPLQPRA